MKNFLLVALTCLLIFSIYNYGLAVKYLGSTKPEIVQVAVNEVPIPMVYDAGELNEYCEYEWFTNKQNGWLPELEA